MSLELLYGEPNPDGYSWVYHYILWPDEPTTEESA